MKTPRGALVALGILFAILCALPQTADAKITKEMIEELRPEIEKGLEANDPLQRAHAILAAGLLKDRKLKKQLEPFLESTNREIRHAAIVALASDGDRKGLKAFDAEIDKAGSGRYVLLTELLPRMPKKIQLKILKGMVSGRRVDKDEQADGLRYIAEYGEGKVYDLLGQITKVRKAADREPYARVLLQYPRDEAFPWAEKLYASKRDEEARRLGMKLAVKIGSPRVAGMARKGLEDDDAAVRKMALGYLAERKDPSATDALLAQLEDAGSDSRKIEIVNQVLEVGHKPPLELAAGLIDSGAEDKALQRAYYKLFGATRSPDAVKRLQKMENSTRIEERRNAIVGLAYTRSPVARQIFTRTLYDGDDEVAQLTVEGMGIIADPKTVKDLQTAMNKARGNKERKRAIVKSLGQIKSDDAANALMFLVRDRDTEVKRLALEGLSNIRSKKVKSVLDILVRDTDPAIRMDATLLLLELDKDDGMRRLDKALQRPPEGYVDLIMELEPTSLRDEVLMAMLKHESDKVRSDAWDALLLMDREGLPLVRQVAAGSFPEDVKSQAIDLLSVRSDAEDTNLFKRLAQTGTEDQKLMAMRWLLRRANPKLSGFFRTLMNGFKANRPMRTVALYGLLKSSK